MSILNNLLNGVLGRDGDSDQKPCASCPANCPVFPNACEECRPCKEKLTALLYDVEHLDAYYDRYEIVPAGTQTGTVTCPACGAPNPATAAACEFCGSQLREGSGKIPVASASEIPDPIQLAQDVIFERHAIEAKYSGGGLLDSISDLLSGSCGDFGDKMTTNEIKAIAAEYSVTVPVYLQGLDNGVYLTAAAKQKQDSSSAAAYAAPIAGAAAYRPAYDDYRPRPAPRQEPPMRRPDPPHHGSYRPEPPRGAGRHGPAQPPMPDRRGAHNGNADFGPRPDRQERGKAAPEFHGKAGPAMDKSRPGGGEKRGNPGGRPSGRGGNPGGRGGDRGRR